MHDQVSEDGRFEALPLNVTGHEVYAVLYVNYPADDLLEGTFYVEASNLYGKETYEFTFEKYIFDWEEEDPEIDEEETEEPKEEPPTASMGAGTITGWFLFQVKFMYVLAKVIHPKYSEHSLLGGNHLVDLIKTEA